MFLLSTPFSSTSYTGVASGKVANYGNICFLPYTATQDKVKFESNDVGRWIAIGL